MLLSFCYLFLFQDKTVDYIAGVKAVTIEGGYAAWRETYGKKK
jgi:hypothetical protein